MSGQYVYRFHATDAKDVGAPVHDRVGFALICVNHFVDAVPRNIRKLDSNIAGPVLRLLGVPFDTRQRLVRFITAEAGIRHGHATGMLILTVDGSHALGVGATEGLVLVGRHLVPGARISFHVKFLDCLTEYLPWADRR